MKLRVPGPWGRARSRENVELAERINSAFNCRDFAAFAETWHHDVEVRDLAHAPDSPEAVKGRRALLTLVAEWHEVFDEFRSEISEYEAVGDHVICATRWIGKGRSSALSIDVFQYDVYEIEDGKIIRATLAYPDKQSARAAVKRGL